MLTSRMAVENHKALRRREILDGIRTWTNAAAKGDHDRFYAEYVVPLRQLRDEGSFESLNEIKAGTNNDIIVIVEIEGPTHFP